MSGLLRRDLVDGLARPGTRRATAQVGQLTPPT